MIGNIGFLALSLYFLLVGLSSTFANLLVPTIAMAALAYVASLGIFVDVMQKWLKKDR